MRGSGSRQLQALARVEELLEGAGIDHWLFGGWAVDFYVGKITRAHDDIDFAVWLDDHPQIAQLLEGDGWRHAPHEGEDGGTGYEREGVRLELTFLVRDDDGRVFIPMSHGRVPWSKQGFAGDARVLHGVRSRVMGLAQLVGGKSAPRDDPEDAAKDRADFTVLSAIAPDPVADRSDKSPD